MNENEFLQQLQKRARLQKETMESVPFPKVFAFIVEWLSMHPWRYLIPLAFLISLILRGIFGTTYTNLILWLFSRL